MLLPNLVLGDVNCAAMRRTAMRACWMTCLAAGASGLTVPRPPAIADIVDRFHQVADQCDAVVVVGSDYTDVATPSELSMNARIAANLGIPVVLTVKGRDRTPDQIVKLVEVCVDEIAAQHAHTAAVVVNRSDPQRMAEIADALQQLEPASLKNLKSYVLPEEPLPYGRSRPGSQRTSGRYALGAVRAKETM